MVGDTQENRAGLREASRCGISESNFISNLIPQCMSDPADYCAESQPLRHKSWSVAL